MAIAFPERNGQRFLSALVTMHETATAIRDQTGDLSYEQINTIQRADVEMRLGVAGLTVNAQAIPGKVLSYLTDRGVNVANLGQVASKVNAINTALAAWRGVVYSVVTALTGSALIDVKALNVQGETLREITQKDAIPGAEAAALRSSQELADIITALEALGA